MNFMFAIDSEYFVMEKFAKRNGIFSKSCDIEKLKYFFDFE
jgi:hypothetical protein